MSSDNRSGSTVPKLRIFEGQKIILAYLVVQSLSLDPAPKEAAAGHL